MKKLGISIVALLLSGVSALAADLPSRKGPAVLPPPPPPPPMWTGFYVGLNAGGTWSNNASIQTVGVPTYATEFWGPGDHSVALAAVSTGYLSGSGNGGFIGGGQIGYNYQFWNNFVVGVEADIQGIAGSSGSRSFVSAAPVGNWEDGESYTAYGVARGSLDYIGTVRGRLGWLLTPSLLVYGTGGFAYGGVSLNTAFQAQSTLGPDFYSPVFGGVNYSNTLTGWTAGGGLEWMFWPNWSAKVEYLYYDLGTVKQNSTLFQYSPFQDNELWGAAWTQTTARINGNIVRAGVNYHFNWGAPAPVVAKY
jgi:outer membrane immunogenic protein